MTNRPAPTAPSAYVAACLAPLAAFAADERVPPDTRGAWALAVCDEVAAAFEALCRDTLANVTKTDSFLRKMQRPDADAPAAAAAASDVDKIALQLWLDAREFGRQLENFASPDELPAYRRLMAVVDTGRAAGERVSRA